MINPHIAAIQLCSGQNIHTNLAQAKLLIEDAVQLGAQLVALPENFSYLDREGNKIHAVENLEDGPAVQLLRELARSNSIYIVGGTVPLAADDRVTNTCLVFGPEGQMIARYDKIHLFDIQLDDAHSFVESRYIAAGKEPVTFEALGATMGLSICYDLRFPELFRGLLDQGAQLVVLPAAFTAATGRAHWESLVRARAIENVMYVIASAQGGYHVNGRTTYGNSMIVDPWGVILNRVKQGAGVAIGGVNLEYLESRRKTFPCIQHRRLK